MTRPAARADRGHGRVEPIPVTRVLRNDAERDASLTGRAARRDICTRHWEPFDEIVARTVTTH